MPKGTKNTERPTRRHAPALTPEDREDQLISLAIDVAEQQLRNGTASAQVVTHYLKLGSIKARLENEKLREENELLRAKTKSLKSQERVEELYERALNAMRSYNGSADEDEDY